MEIHSWCETSFPPLPVACHLAGGAMQTPCTILRRRTERQLTAKAGSADGAMGHRDAVAPGGYPWSLEWLPSQHPDGPLHDFRPCQ